MHSSDLYGILSEDDIVRKEDQKEDFIKELPLVADYCK